VAAFAPEPFALRLGLSPAAGAAYLADALDLWHRLPHLLARVRRLEVPDWQARRVAQQTRRLPLEGARWVDDQLAHHARGSLGPVIVDRLVAQAAAQFDPPAQQERENQAEAGWDVDLTTPAPTDYTGTSHLDITGDTPTLKDFHDLVCTIAAQLGRDGDTSPLGVRTIKALRLITAAARGQATLDLHPSGSAGSAKVSVYVHVDAADLDPDAPLAVGRVEKLGPATLAKIKHWVGHHQITIRPVLNMQRGDGVDVHDPPHWMRDLVILRDQHCVFPNCTRDARSCDLDHIQPYDPHGPKGQTHPANLAALCRRHHRAKTTTLWRYTRTPQGHYLWHGPHAATYLVTLHGTLPATGPP
jgi:hypothetical protein